MTGSTVTLSCSNKSIDTLNQLTWKMNGENLFAWQNNTSIYISKKATSLNLEKPNLKSDLYELLIERAQKYHAGNYSCETTTKSGVHQNNWELVITGVQNLILSYQKHIFCGNRRE